MTPIGPGVRDTGSPDDAGGPVDTGVDAFVMDGSWDPPDAGLDAGVRSDAAIDAGRPDAAGPPDASCAPASETCDGQDDDCDGLIDDGPNVCGCPVEFFGGRPYIVCTQARTWAQARRFCENRGYDLVIIDSAEEDAWIWTTTQDLAPGEVWIGMTDQGENGLYMWVDGRVAWDDEGAHGYEAWRDGMPEDIASEHCIHMDLAAGGGWADSTCGSTKSYVCELLDD